MFTRCIIMIVLAAVVGAVLLDLRQQRIDAMYEMAAEHKRIRNAREKLWDMQTRIADKLEPEKLEAAIDRAGLQLQPIHDAPPSDTWHRGSIATAGDE